MQGLTVLASLLAGLVILDVIQQSYQKIPDHVWNRLQGFNNTQDFIMQMLKKKPLLPAVGRPGEEGPSGPAALLPGEDILFPEVESSLPNQEGAELVAASITVPSEGCVPKEVAVYLPPPDDLDVIHFPMCTNVMRCGGCCAQEQDLCQPTRATSKVVQVIKARYGNEEFEFEGLHDMFVEEHLECACRCRNQPHHCDPLKQTYDPNTCTCRCLNQDEVSACPAHKQWDNQKCACVCPYVAYCMDDEYFSFSSCRCETGSNIMNSPDSSSSNPCPDLRCRAGFAPVKILGICRCEVSASWGDLQAGSLLGQPVVTMPPTTTTTEPPQTPRPRRPRPRPRRQRNSQ